MLSGPAKVEYFVWYCFAFCFGLSVPDGEVPPDTYGAFRQPKNGTFMLGVQFKSLFELKIALTDQIG